jgi:hypothetical protein
MDVKPVAERLDEVAYIRTALWLDCELCAGRTDLSDNSAAGGSSSVKSLLLG